ncbi:hypothetical protein Esti_001442 [Eimeria stiedai]
MEQQQVAAVPPPAAAAAGGRPPAEGTMVVVVDLNPSAWRRPSPLNTFLANAQPLSPQLQQQLAKQQQQQQQHNSSEALVRYLEFLSGAVSRFARIYALMSPQSIFAVVGMNDRTSKLLHEAETPNWLLVQSGLEDHETPLQQALVEFATQGSPPAAAAAAGGSLSAAAAASGAADAALAARSNDGDARGVTGQRDAAGAAVADNASRQQCSLREGESLLSGALSIALCYVHRWRGGGPSAESRVLLLDASQRGSYAAQHIPLLNIAFAASKTNVAIDCCALLPDCSTIPEQLCDVARGRHSRFAPCFSEGAHGRKPAGLRADIALLQLLLFWFLPPPSLRTSIAAVSVHQKANTAVCFCHHTPVDLCFICSCCLAIYCSETTDTGKERISCDVCKSRFAKGLLKTKLAASVDVSKY